MKGEEELKTNQPASEPSRERPAAETRREIRREIKDGSKSKEEWRQNEEVRSKRRIKNS
jgi:hypothetical protein